MQIQRSRSMAQSKYAPYDIEAEEAASLALTEIDVSKIRLKILLNESIQDLKTVNPLIRARLAELCAQGCVLLDAEIAEALLASPQDIPKAWRELADSDEPGPQYGAIRFDGTVFKDRVTNERRVVAPFLARNSWQFGWTAREYSPADLAVWKKQGGAVYFREYTAVLEPAAR